MKKTTLTAIFVLMFVAISIAQKQRTAPKIISTIPEFGDCDVDPGLNEVILKFDQDMGQGMSVVNSKNMPQITDRPKWIDNRTFSIPVKLYPNRLYSLLFNSRKYQNFRNINRVPLNPDELYFKTSVVSDMTNNKQAYQELTEIFPKKYSYASLRKINWESLLDKNRSKLENSETNIEFALKLVKLLKSAEDLHLWVEVEGQKFETSKTKIVEQNFGSKKSLFSLLQNKIVSKISITGVIDNTGYISIHNWNDDFFNLSHRSLENPDNPEIPAHDVLEKLFKYPDLIIDVRENSGGNEIFAKKFASYFVNDTVPYEKVKSYNEESGLFDKEHIKNLYPNEKGFVYSGKVYVLSGPDVVSSNEAFILMMKQVPNATVVGMKTYGSSGNPIPYELANGVTVYIPSWQAYTLEGKLVEGNGIEPDIKIKTAPSDFKTSDFLIEKVIKLIKRKK